MDSLLKRFKRNERFFFESVGVPEGSTELGKGNLGWVPLGEIIVFKQGEIQETTKEMLYAWNRSDHSDGHFLPFHELCLKGYN